MIAEGEAGYQLKTPAKSRMGDIVGPEFHFAVEADDTASDAELVARK